MKGVIAMFKKIKAILADYTKYSCEVYAKNFMY